MKTRIRTNAEHPKRLRRSGRALIVAVFLTVATLLAPPGIGGSASAKPTQADAPRPTIVLVHGDWADASSWNSVVGLLQRRGFTVVAPPNPLRGPVSDAAYLASFLQTIQGPIVLVAHSYGGFVATNAATGNPNIRALVYVDAFVPDLGQTLADLTAGSCVDPATALEPVPSAGGVVDVYLRIGAFETYGGFSKCFANGVDPKQTALLGAVQRPATINQYFEPSGPPAWKSIPTWALLGTDDQVIPIAQQRAMATNAGAKITTVDTGHLSLVIRPDAVTKVIEAAVDATS